MNQEPYKTPEESEIIISQLMLPTHTNFGGKINGGYILNLMDQVAFACASKYSGHYCVTASVNTVDFIKPIEVGRLVSLKAMVNYVGNTSMVIGIRVESQNIQTSEIIHCNSSYFLMVALDENGNSTAVPKLKIRNNTQVKRFIKAIQILELKKEQKNLYNQVKTLPDDFKEILENQNVILDYSI